MEVDPRVVEAMGHVQKAGLELISAMRNALDVAEDLLGDPHAAIVLLQGAAAAATAAATTATAAAKAATEPLQRIRVDD
jgi:hypothetical protein